MPRSPSPTTRARPAGRLPGAGAFAALPGIVITLLLLALHVAEIGPLRELGLRVFDSFQRAAPRRYEAVPVRVVDIDDATVARRGQWPWPRTEVARLTRALTEAGAAAIAFDIVFAEPDRTSPARIATMLADNPAATSDYADIRRLPDHDTLLAATFANSPAVLGYFLTYDPGPSRPAEHAGFAVVGTVPGAALPGFPGAIPALPNLGSAASGEGFVSIVADRDATVRRAPMVARLAGELVPSLALEALRVAQGAGAITLKGSDAAGEFGGGGAAVALQVGAFTAPLTPAGELWVHFTPPEPRRIVPAWRVLGGLEPDEAKRLFAGHIVFVGAGASGLRDLVATPLEDRTPGVLVHAQAAEQIILQRFLVRPDWAAGAERAAILVLGLGLAVLLPGLGAGWGSALAGFGLGVVGGGSWLAFRGSGLLLDPTVPGLAALGSYVGVTALSFWREERARRYIRGAFDRFLAPELVERIARDPGQLELGGEERDMTVMFADIRGFSALSERMRPQDIIGFLIEFLTPMTEVLLARRATIDKYIGDAILAFWNAPLDDPDHAANAAHAALGMIVRLRELNDPGGRPADSLWPGVVRIGIGLNTGRCCVGNMGSAQRLSYSLIGDTVNLASRIEGLTKFYGVDIAVGEELAARLPGFALLELDRVRVVGRVAPQTVFALLGPPGAPPAAIVEPHAAMLAAYRSRDWDAAATLLADPGYVAHGLGRLADRYAERIARYRTAPPPADWDGVFEAFEK